jgi:hypothetical protein
VCGSLVRRNRCPPLREGDCSTRCQGADRYNSEHGSWLNIAECELSVLERQCLARRLPNINTPTREVTAWKQQRNQAHVTLDWRFTTADARIRLKRLYPVLKEQKEQKAA